MDISNVHEPETVSHTVTYTRLTWKCTCGAFSAGPYARSQYELRIQYELEHRYPDVARAVPHHDFIKTDGEFGGVGWACSCGTRGRPEGHKDERRARQGHAQHSARAIVLWLDAVHRHSLSLLTPQQRRSREAILNWQRKDAATRKAQAAHFLSQIL